MTTFRKILAIDPGYARLGYAVIESNGRENKFVAAGLIETKAGESWDKRILKIAGALEKIFNKYEPSILVVEKIFFSSNQKTAFKVAEIKGIIGYLAAKYDIPVQEISPRELKIAISGYGLADKKQMQKIVKLTLEIPESIKIDDVFDALALALAAMPPCGYLGIKRYLQKNTNLL